MSPEWEQAAILRRCRRCLEWRSIKVFRPMGKVCERCIGHAAVVGRARTIVLIPQDDSSKAG